VARSPVGVPARRCAVLAEIFGPDLLIVLIVVVVVLFGGAAIPKLARNLGSAQGEFKKGMADSKDAEAPKAVDTTTDEQHPSNPTNQS
jgi:sec-independent protein translocase protein TatA